MKLYCISLSAVYFISIHPHLHEGKSVEEVKAQFEEAFSGVSASEISEAEHALIIEGIDVSEIQRLCDVHAAVFGGSVEEIHEESDPTKTPGHPAYILVEENKIIDQIIKTQIIPFLQPDSLNKEKLYEGLKTLSKLELHYLRKENVIFPYLEKHDITAPPKVMWGVHDEIRAQLKEAKSLANDKSGSGEELIEKTKALVNKISDMIFKEENILIPLLQETLTAKEWAEIAQNSHEIGFLIDVPEVSSKIAEAVEDESNRVQLNGEIRLPSGIFSTEELTAFLNTLPFDVTFVDKNDQVKYFTEGSERIFPRPRSVIGRNVSNCHPPHSVHIVNKIIEDFKNGVKDHEDFWIRMKDKFVYIRYFAVRNENNEYLGVVEVTQNIKPIQEITGEKRLVAQ
ncbi:MAG: DUF438 domain-containing protein [Acutalibacteraceae bacterium]